MGIWLYKFFLKKLFADNKAFRITKHQGRFYLQRKFFGFYFFIYASGWRVIVRPYKIKLDVWKRYDPFYTGSGFSTFDRALEYLENKIVLANREAERPSFEWSGE